MTDFAAEVTACQPCTAAALKIRDLPLAMTNPECEPWELDPRERSTPYDVELLSIWGVGMDRDDQKFVAVEGLHVRASAILTQAERLELAREQLSKGSAFRRAYLCEKHFLLIAAKKLIDYIDWARDLAFLDDAVFGSMLRLRGDILDLKITNEHVIEYYQGVGCRLLEHWTFADELIVVDASPIAGKRIGNRLDGQDMAEAASSLLIALPRHLFPGR